MKLSRAIIIIVLLFLSISCGPRITSNIALEAPVMVEGWSVYIYVTNGDLWYWTRLTRSVPGISIKLSDEYWDYSEGQWDETRSTVPAVRVDSVHYFVKDSIFVLIPPEEKWLGANGEHYMLEIPFVGAMPGLVGSYDVDYKSAPRISPFMKEIEAVGWLSLRNNSTGEIYQHTVQVVLKRRLWFWIITPLFGV